MSEPWWCHCGVKVKGRHCPDCLYRVQKDLERTLDRDFALFHSIAGVAGFLIMYLAWNESWGEGATAAVLGWPLVFGALWAVARQARRGPRYPDDGGP